MSWQRLTSIGLEGQDDIVVARTRAVQSCALFSVPTLERTRFTSAVALLARQVVAVGGGRVLLEGCARPAGLRASFSGPRGWAPEVGRDLIEVEHTPQGARIEVRVGAEITEEALRSAGGQLARMRHGLGGSASLVSENQSLRSALDELDRESRRATLLASRLEERNRDLELFASAASHDLREPLVVVSLYARLVRTHLDQGDLEAAREAVGTIEASMAHARSMLEGLAAYGRLAHEEHLDSRAEPEALLEQLQEALRARIQATGAVLHIERPIPAVRLRSEHLAQVLQNLLTNAMKFCDGAPEIHIRGRRRPNGVHLVVQDHGLGIPQERLEQIFRIFGRAHPDKPGTGVGLALVARIVRAAGGRILVDSEVGRGTTFTLVLPPV